VSGRTGSGVVAEIVTIGDELLLGFTVDTNGAYLARALANIGIAVGRRTSVGDSLGDIERAVREALDRSGLVITTGGLGPTKDDMSKAAVARIFDRRLEVDAEHVTWMRDRWRTRFGREMPESNVAQALIPVGATKLRNNHGSAPGIMIEDGRGLVIMLPGVPREMRGMTDDTVVPLLSSRSTAGSVVRSFTLRTTGVAESLLGDQLRDMPLSTDVTLAYLPSPEGADLRLTSRGRAVTDADRELSVLAAEVRRRVGDAVYGEGDTDLAAVVLDLCRKEGHTIAVAESCTGGLLGARLTAIPGSSDVVLGGVIAYHNDVKQAQLDVSAEMLRSHGAVSEPVVRQMAIGVAAQFGVSCTLAITGVAGPTGGTPDKPVGTVWIASSVAGDVQARRLSLIGDRDEIRRRSAQAALEMLRRRLIAQRGG
jgi:nicotinamide-nucleotide amidase